jgi:hypothetical protein
MRSIKQRICGSRYTGGHTYDLLMWANDDGTETLDPNGRCKNCDLLLPDYVYLNLLERLNEQGVDDRES